MAKSFEYDFNRWEQIKESIHELREDGKTDVAEILRASFLYDSVPAYPGIPKSLSSPKQSSPSVLNFPLLLMLILAKNCHDHSPKAALK